MLVLWIINEANLLEINGLLFYSFRLFILFNYQLKSDDFFEVNKFETASLSINKVIEIKSKSHSVTAELTIKGITKTINFVAQIDENNLNANIKIDRTKFDVKYSSGNFLDGLVDNMIYDELIVNLEI